MMTAGRARPRLLTRGQRTLLYEILCPAALMMLILLIAVAVSYIVTEPLFHPNLHPRVIKFFYYLTHYHPRLCQCIGYGALALYAGLQIFSVFGVKYATMWARKKGPLTVSDLKSEMYLNQGLKQTFGILSPQAWQILKAEFSGLLIEVAGLRDTHWEVLECDERRREMRLVLHYVRAPLGEPVSRIYPRKLCCTAALRGRGMSTDVELTYCAGSAMDYKTVYEIIDQTNFCVKAAMLGNLAMACKKDVRRVLVLKPTSVREKT